MDRTEFEKLVDSMLAVYFDPDNIVQVHSHLVPLSKFNDPKIKTLRCIECGELLNKEPKC